MDINNEFDKSVEFIRTSKENPNIDSDTKLTFYKYYKQATVGDCNTEQPSMFYMSDRAKWDAWNAIKGTSKNDAMKLYIYHTNKYR